jgi:hypothetical protein
MVNVDEITPERVRQVLRHLSRDRTPGRTALAELTVVRRALEDAGFYPTPAAREYELGRLLVELVERELAMLRRRAALAAPADRPERALQADFGHGLRELESWSALYHLYLRPDLDLSLKGFAELLDDRHRRTIQRRLRRGVTALTGRLQAAERTARLAELAERCAARIPPPTSADLVGVAGLLRRLAGRLGDPAASRVLALHGPGGIGKTALATALARDAVQRETFASVAWIDAEGAAATPLDLAAAIARQLGDGGENADGLGDARRRLARRPTLVVVDGVDEPGQALAAVEALAMVRGASKALVTGRVGWSAWPELETLEVPALDAGAAAVLLRQEVRRRGLDDVASASDDVLRPVLRATAGHPLAIRLAAGQLRADEPDSVAAAFAAGEGPMAALVRELWAPAWRRLSDDGRRVVLAACRADEPPARREEIASAAGLPAPALSAALGEAIDLGLLLPASATGLRGYRPGLFLRRFVRRLGAGAATSPHPV